MLSENVKKAHFFHIFSTLLGGVGPRACGKKFDLAVALPVQIIA